MQPSKYYTRQSIHVETTRGRIHLSCKIIGIINPSNETVRLQTTTWHERLIWADTRSITIEINCFSFPFDNRSIDTRSCTNCLISVDNSSFMKKKRRYPRKKLLFFTACSDKEYRLTDQSLDDLSPNHRDAPVSLWSFTLMTNEEDLHAERKTRSKSYFNLKYHHHDSLLLLLVPLLFPNDLSTVVPVVWSRSFLHEWVSEDSVLSSWRLSRHASHALFSRHLSVSPTFSTLLRLYLHTLLV